VEVAVLVLVVVAVKAGVRLGVGVGGQPPTVLVTGFDNTTLWIGVEVGMGVEVIVGVKVCVFVGPPGVTVNVLVGLPVHMLMVALPIMVLPPHK
jgi:hypothetical protein